MAGSFRQHDVQLAAARADAVLCVFGGVADSSCSMGETARSARLHWKDAADELPRAIGDRHDNLLRLRTRFLEPLRSGSRPGAQCPDLRNTGAMEYLVVQALPVRTRRMVMASTHLWSRSGDAPIARHITTGKYSHTVTSVFICVHLRPKQPYPRLQRRTLPLSSLSRHVLMYRCFDRVAARS